MRNAGTIGWAIVLLVIGSSITWLGMRGGVGLALAALFAPDSVRLIDTSGIGASESAGKPPTNKSNPGGTPIPQISFLSGQRGTAITQPIGNTNTSQFHG